MMMVVIVMIVIVVGVTLRPLRGPRLGALDRRRPHKRIAAENNTPPDRLAGGIWGALISMAGGLAVAIPTYAGYNYLVSRVNSIVLDMEKASTEILNIVSSATNP